MSLMLHGTSPSTTDSGSTSTSAASNAATADKMAGSRVWTADEMAADEYAAMVANNMKHEADNTTAGMAAQAADTTQSGWGIRQYGYFTQSSDNAQFTAAYESLRSVDGSGESAWSRIVHAIAVFIAVLLTLGLFIGSLLGLVVLAAVVLKLLLWLAVAPVAPHQMPVRLRVPWWYARGYVARGTRNRRSWRRVHTLVDPSTGITMKLRRHVLYYLLRHRERH